MFKVDVTLFETKQKLSFSNDPRRTQESRMRPKTLKVDPLYDPVNILSGVNKGKRVRSARHDGR